MGRPGEPKRASHPKVNLQRPAWLLPSAWPPSHHPSVARDIICLCLGRAFWKQLSTFYFPQSPGRKTGSREESPPLAHNSLYQQIFQIRKRGQGQWGWWGGSGGRMGQTQRWGTREPTSFLGLPLWTPSLSLAPRGESLTRGCLSLPQFTHPNTLGSCNPEPWDGEVDTVRRLLGKDAAHPRGMSEGSYSPRAVPGFLARGECTFRGSGNVGTEAHRGRPRSHSMPVKG